MIAVQILRFGLVGCIGFLTDTGVLLLIVGNLPVTALPARVISFLVAASVTFWLNRRYTFEASGGSGASQWLRYVAATGLGAFINIGVFYAWISTMGVQPSQLIAGSAVGSVTAMILNYFVSRTMVFRSR